MKKAEAISIGVNESDAIVPWKADQSGDYFFKSFQDEDKSWFVGSENKRGSRRRSGSGSNDAMFGRRPTEELEKDYIQPRDQSFIEAVHVVAFVNGLWGY